MIALVSVRLKSKGSRLARLAAALTILLLTSDAFGQGRVKVIYNDTPIWRAGFFVTEVTVAAGTELEVIARQGDWYEVRVPSTPGAKVRTGFVAVSRVELLDASKGSPGPPTARTQKPVSSGLSSALPALRFRGFASLGVGRFAATEAFSAVFGDARGVWFGGGGEIVTRHGWFVAGSVDRFRRTGERAAIYDGEVYPLGVADTLTVMPVAATGGYQWRSGTVSPYLGGGVERVFYREDVMVSETRDRTTVQETGYHVAGGAELRASKLVGIAVEARYTTIHAGTVGGAAEAFDEQDLGGIQLRVRLLIGK